MGDHTSDRMLWISIPVKPSRSAGERRAFNNTRNSGIRLVLLDSERCYDDAAASSVDLVGGSISACPMIGRNRTEESDESAALQLKDGILPFSHELQISDRFLQENDDSRRKQQIACFASASSTTKQSPCPPENL